MGIIQEFLRRELLGIDRSFLVALKHTLNLQSHNTHKKLEDEGDNIRLVQKIDVEQSFRTLNIQNTEDQGIQEESFLNELKKSWISSRYGSATRIVNYILNFSRHRWCSRLNIYRRCFQHLCDNFKIYGELMTEIKAAYENMIAIMNDDSNVLSASNKTLKKGFNRAEQELFVRSRRWKVAR